MMFFFLNDQGLVSKPSDHLFYTEWFSLSITFYKYSDQYIIIYNFACGRMIKKSRFVFENSSFFLRRAMLHNEFIFSGQCSTFLCSVSVFSFFNST